jgi:hypothetical protein
MEDARLAVETGVDGLDVVIGTSSFLREHSHGKSMAYITKTIVRGTMSQDQEDSHVSNKNCARAQTAVLLQDMTFSSQ